MNASLEENAGTLGYLLEHEKLVGMLERAGFRNIKKIKVRGERNYDVFLAQK